VKTRLLRGAQRARRSHAVRVAAVSTVIVAALYVALVAALDGLVAHRLTGQIDSRLLARSAPLAHLTSSGVVADHDDVREAPMFVWRVAGSGAATALEPGAPAMPSQLWPATAAFEGVTLGGTTFRVHSQPSAGGWLVVGVSTAESSHLRTVLVMSEALVAPVLLAAAYITALLIGLMASAPVERQRRRQLEFTADASHELRTPLSVIEAEVSLVLSLPRNEAYYRATFQRVQGESHRLRRIVDDLLWLARHDADLPVPEPELIELAVLTRAAAARFTPLASTAGVCVSFEQDDADIALVDMPSEWADRLLGVLLDNACRYAGPGGRVVVRGGVVAGRVRLAVEDSGPGIPEHERERLFDRFHRATLQPGGAGLGLAIADSVVRRTRGRWRVADSSLGGACFEVSWPRPSSRRSAQWAGGRSAAVPKPGAQPGPDLAEEHDAQDRAQHHADDHGAPAGEDAAEPRTAARRHGARHPVEGADAAHLDDVTQHVDGHRAEPQDEGHLVQGEPRRT
jgi:two-component system sensor histidine kinase CiaH